MERPLRVCAVLHEAAALGAGLSLARVAAALRDCGCELSVILPAEGPLEQELAGFEVVVATPPRALAVSLRGWREPPGPAARARQSRAYLRSVRSALARLEPDVVHANSLHALIEAALGRRLGLPVVLEAHEIPRPGLKRSVSTRAASVVAQEIVAVSQAVARAYAPARRLRVVHNGVALREQLDPPEELRVGTIGYISDVKGTDVFVDAAAIVRERRPEIAFEHLGPRGLASERDLDARLARSDAGRSVTFLGPGEGAAALARWSIFVLPSRSEGFPLVSLEAMAAGLPVIASAVGGIPEQITDGQTGVLVAPADARALAQAILGLADDPARRAALGAAGRAHVRAAFTYERQAEGLRAAYLAARRGR